MNEADIQTYLMINEPAFDIGQKQYAVCCVNGTFGTWDSDGNTFDFPTVQALLDGWIVDGRPFREVLPTILYPGKRGD